MRFFCNKHVIRLLAVWLSICLVLVGYAHDKKGHAKDIGVVFGWFYPENDKEPIKKHTSHGKELRNNVGKIIADLIDDGARDFHRKVNKELGDICCDSKYSSLYIKGYNQKISDLKERIKIADTLLEESNRDNALSRLRRKEAIQALHSISEEMQNDFFFDRACSVNASNVESTLKKLEEHLEYKHDFYVSSDKVRSAFKELKDILDKIPEMSQSSQVEAQTKIRDLAASERLFKWGKYGHRLYFHWGMDVNIQKFKQLNDCIDRSCAELEKTFFPHSDARRRGDVPLRSAEDNAKFQELQGKLREKIYSLIEYEWKERKRTAFDDLYSCLGEYHNDILVLSDDQCEMLLKLAYYVHILGDYETSNTSALIAESGIKEALMNDIFKDEYWESKDGNRDITKLTNALQSKDTAEDMLNFLKANIPVLIEKSLNIKNALWVP